MKSARRSACVCVFALFTAAAVASAQSLDGKWFVMNCKAHIRAVDTTTGDFAVKSYSFKVYIHFIYKSAVAPNGARYDIDIYSETSPGVWEVKTSYTDIQTSGYTEHFFPDIRIIIFNKNGVSMDCYITPYVSASPAKFSAGGEVFNGYDPKIDRLLFGWILITGTVAKKLPFTP